MSQNLIITLIIIILQSFIALVSATYKISDNRRNNLKRFNRSGWIFIIFSIMTIVFSYFQSRFNEAEKEQAARELQEIDRKSKVRDSINNKLINDKYISTIKALAEYSLEYDTAQGKIIKILKDSLGQRQTINKYGEDPEFDICALEGITHTGNEDKYKMLISFCAKNAPCNIRVDLSLFYNYKGEYYFAKTFKKLVQTSYLGGEPRITGDINFNSPEPTNKRDKINEVFIFTDISFSDYDNKRKLSIEHLYCYDLNQRTIKLMPDEDRDKVKFLIP